MNRQTIDQVAEYARQKGIYVKDILTHWLDGLLTDGECYNKLAGRISEKNQVQ